MTLFLIKILLKMFWGLCLLGTISSRSLEKDIACGNYAYFNLFRTWKWLGINLRQKDTSGGFIFFTYLEIFKAHTHSQRVRVILKQHRNVKQEQLQLLPRCVCGEWRVCAWSLVAPLLLRVRCHGLQLPWRFKLGSQGAREVWDRSTIHRPVPRKKWKMSV